MRQARTSLGSRLRARKYVIAGEHFRTKAALRDRRDRVRSILSAAGDDPGCREIEGRDKRLLLLLFAHHPARTSKRLVEVKRVYSVPTAVGRQFQVELSKYRESNGEERHTSGTFLDACGAGLVISAGGARTVIAWASLNVVELSES